MTVFLLALYIIVIFVRPMEWWVPIHEWPLLEYLAILLMPAAFITASRDSIIKCWKFPESKLAVIFLFAASLSNFFIWFPAMIETFQELGKVILLYVVMLLVVKKDKNFSFILWIIFLCIGWMALHGFLQMDRGYGFGGLYPLWRQSDKIYQIIAYGIFNDPNALCLVFIIALPILYSEFRNSSDVIVKMIALILMAMFVIATWLTNSRGGVVGFFGMAAGYAILRMRGLYRWSVIVFIAAIIFVFAPARFAGNITADMSRAALWGIGLAIFKQRPIFGAGYGNYGDYSGGMLAHNSYITVLGEAGIVGYIPWFLLIYFTMTHLCRTLNFSSSISNHDANHLLGIFSALCGYLTAAYFITRSYDYVLFILLALALAKIWAVADEYGLHKGIFGDIKIDLKRGAIFSAVSIAVIYVSILAVNVMGGKKPL